MTPVEKANELVNKMFNCDKSTPEESMAMLYPHALQCAIIAVEEIMDWRLQELDELIKSENLKADLGGIAKQSKLLNHWQQVKHEIEYMYTKQLTK